MVGALEWDVYNLGVDEALAFGAGRLGDNG
jgi:hypothetical protein